jgi:sporulation protein YtfJ
MAHPISDLMNTTMEKIRDMMDANTVVGKPIEAGGVTVIPVCKISIGYGSGGSDFAQKNQKPDRDNAFGGGAGMGVNITPISFLVIRDGNVRMVSLDQPESTAVERVIELVPEVVDKVGSAIGKKKAEKEDISE